jgi:hypothetical protein
MVLAPRTHNDVRGDGRVVVIRTAGDRLAIAFGRKS